MKKLLSTAGLTGEIKYCIDEIINNTDGALEFLFRDDKELHILLSFGQVYFCVSDIINILEYEHLEELYSSFDKNNVVFLDMDDSKYDNEIYHMNEHEDIYEYLNRLDAKHNYTVFTTSNGLFRMLIKSRSSKAKKFQEWVCNSLLNNVCNYGYHASTNVMNKLNESPTEVYELNRNIKHDSQESQSTQRRNLVDVTYATNRYNNITVFNTLYTE